MGSACSSCRGPVFTSLDIRGTDDNIVKQLQLRPGLLSSPVPSAFLGLQDTALHLASERKNLQALQQLIGFLAAADLDVVQAALLPYCRRLKLPLPGSCQEAIRLAVNATNNKGQTPLMYACYADCAEAARELLEKGAHPWVVDNCGERNALHYAAMVGSTACIEALLKCSPQNLLVRQGQRLVNSRSLSGLTPLHYAIAFNHTAAVSELLAHGPNINAASTGESFDVFVTYDTLSTPLHFAAVKNNLAAAALLLRYYFRHRRNGSVLDPRMRCNSAGQLPWQLARSNLLAAMLQPRTSAAAALQVPQAAAALAMYGSGGGGGDEDDDGEVGPPPLAVLAAAALRQKLLASLEAVEHECVGDEEEEAGAKARASRTGSRRGSMLLCGATPRRGNALPIPLSPSLSRLTRLSRLASGRLSRRGTASVPMPASPRRAPTLERLGSRGSPVTVARYEGVPGQVVPEDFLDAAAGAATGTPSRHSQQQQRRQSQPLSQQLSRQPSRNAAATAAGGAGTAGSPAVGITTANSLSPSRPTGRISLGGGLSSHVRQSTERATANGNNRYNATATGRTVSGPLINGHLSTTPAGFGKGRGGKAGGGNAGSGGGFSTPTISPFAGLANAGASPSSPPISTPPPPLANSANRTCLGATSIPGAPSIDGDAVAGGSDSALGPVGHSTGGVGDGGGAAVLFNAGPVPLQPAGGSPTSSERLFAVPHRGNPARLGSLPPLATPPGGSSPTHGSGGYRYTNGGGDRTLSGAGSGLPYPPTSNMLSPAASFAALGGGGGGSETMASAFAAVNILRSYDNGTEDGGGGGDGDWDEDGICNVCFARPEAAAPATCRHGLCTVCAGELCRAVAARPLLCPFCRRPVTDFVRVAVRPSGKRRTQSKQ